MGGCPPCSRGVPARTGDPRRRRAAAGDRGLGAPAPRPRRVHPARLVVGGPRVAGDLLGRARRLRAVQRRWTRSWGAYGTLLRAWSIILAGAFGVLALVDTRRPLFARALSAVAMTLVAALGITTALRAPTSVVGSVVSEQYDRRNARRSPGCERWPATGPRSGRGSSASIQRDGRPSTTSPRRCRR